VSFKILHALMRHDCMSSTDSMRLIPSVTSITSGLIPSVIVSCSAIICGFGITL